MFVVTPKDKIGGNGVAHIRSHRLAGVKFYFDPTVSEFDGFWKRSLSTLLHLYDNNKIFSNPPS